MSASRQPQQPTGDTRPQRPAADAADRLLEEHNLLKLEALMFTTERAERLQHARQLAEQPASRTTITRRDGRGNEVSIVVDPEFGVPGDVAYRVFHAAMYKLTRGAQACDATGVCRLCPSVYFTKRELARLSGRSWAGGKDDDDYYAAVMQLYHSGFKMHWRSEEGTEQEIHLRPFVTAYFARRQESARGEFDQCMIDFHPRIVENYAAGHFRIFNMQRLLHLRPVGMILYKRLFLTFGYLKRQGVEDRRLRLEKDYDAVCREWLGGHRPRRYHSEIVRHLAVHLESLKRIGVLRRYEISKKVSGEGHKLTFWPGPAFAEDYALYYDASGATQLTNGVPAGPLIEQEALAVLADFHTRLGRTHREFGRRELAQAEALLRELAREEADDLIAFALEHRAQNVEPQVFGFVLGYLERWKVAREERARTRERRETIEACPFCNQAGFVDYRAKDGFWRTMPCPHDQQALADFASRTGARFPAPPKG